MNKLGRFREEGWHGRVKLASARRWYQRAATRGCFRGQFHLARFLADEGDIDGAVHLLSACCDTAPLSFCREVGTMLAAHVNPRLASVGREALARADSLVPASAADAGGHGARYARRMMADPGVRAFWLKHLHRWHWISAGLCLVGMLLFAVTGITLNHAGSIEAKPQVTSREAQLPEALLKSLPSGEQVAPLPADVRRWIADNVSVPLDERKVEWQKREIYVSLPRPGGDAWLTIDRQNGDIEYELTDRGWVSYLNDLHKGRNAGLMWSLVHRRLRGRLPHLLHHRAVPPAVSLRAPSGDVARRQPGIVIPVVLLLLFVH